mgnify:CR=1 FL=1
MSPRRHVDMIFIVFMFMDRPVGILGVALIVLEFTGRLEGDVNKASHVGIILIIMELIDCLMGNIEKATYTTTCIVTRTSSSCRIKGRRSQDVERIMR